MVFQLDLAWITAWSGDGNGTGTRGCRCIGRWLRVATWWWCKLGVDVWRRRIMVLTSEEFLAGRTENTEYFSHSDEPEGYTQGTVGVDQELIRRQVLGVGWNYK
jgi:hypothetical protein